MQKIEYKQNGFLIDNNFITYQSVVSIKAPKIISYQLPDQQTTKFIPYSDRYMIYYIDVEIELINQTSIHLKSDIIKFNIYEDTKFLFKNVLSKKITFKQYFWKIPNKNTKYLEFNENSSELELLKDNIKLMREKLITSFNKWRIYYFN